LAAVGIAVTGIGLIAQRIARAIAQHREVGLMPARVYRQRQGEEAAKAFQVRPNGAELAR
jgi:hypothetical protein